MNVERTREYADAHIPGSPRSKADFRSAPVSAGNERRKRLPYAITLSDNYILILYEITISYYFKLLLLLYAFALSYYFCFMLLL